MLFIRSTLSSFNSSFPLGISLSGSSTHDSLRGTSWGLRSAGGGSVSGKRNAGGSSMRRLLAAAAFNLGCSVAPPGLSARGRALMGGSAERRCSSSVGGSVTGGGGAAATSSSVPFCICCCCCWSSCCRRRGGGAGFGGSAGRILAGVPSTRPLFIVGVASGVPSGVEVLCGGDSVKFCCKKRFQVKLMFSNFKKRYPL